MIEAYCLRQSYAQSEVASVCVSTDVGAYDAIVERMGPVPEAVWLRRGLPGTFHATPADAVEHGCRWPVAFEVATAEGWKSGFYRLSLVPAEGDPSEAFFVLRAATPSSRALWVIETNTWNAYNTFGGASTYTTDGRGYLGGAACVSFQRPLPRGFITMPPDAPRYATTPDVAQQPNFYAWATAHEFSVWSGAASWSQRGARFEAWLAEQGLTLDYATSADLHANPDLLRGYGMLLSVGHDEYWSWEMRDSVESFIAGGGNVAFLSGNTAFWQVRLLRDCTQMIAYKAAVDADPVMGTPDERRNSGLWSHCKTTRPENAMTGLSFTRGGYARMFGAAAASAGGYSIYRPEHWALSGTGLGYGDQFGAACSLVGYECDGCAIQFCDGRPRPTGEDGTPPGLEIIGMAPAVLWSKETAPSGLYPDGSLSDLEVVALQLTGRLDADTLASYAYGHAVMGAYVHSSGGIVFNGGSADWAFGLSDPQVSRVTRNVFERFTGGEARGS